MADRDFRTPDSEKKANEQYAPYSDGETASRLHHQEREAGEGANTGSVSNSEGSDGASGSNTKNIDSAKEQEEDDSEWKTPSGSWKNSYVDPAGKRQKITIKNFFKKKGPASLIIGLLLGGGGIVSFFSPGLLIIDLKEKLVNGLDDQLATMDIRTTTMLKKKFKGSVSGVCTTKISLRCKFNSVGDKQLKKFEDAGLKVNKSGKTLLGRTKIDSLEFTNEAGKTIKVNASNFSDSLRSNPEFRGAMLKAYSSKLAAHADSLAAKFLKKVGITKQKNITGDNDKEREKSVIDEADGDAVAQDTAKVSTKDEDCTGDADGCVDGHKTTYIDDQTGEELTKKQYDLRLKGTNSLPNELKLRKSLAETGGKIGKATLKGALTVTALGLGAVDTACTGYTLIRTVSFAAKYLGSLQLLRFAHIFLNTADSIKALLADPDAVSYAGRILTTPNSEGKTATDSYGVHYAYYGDAPTMPRSDDIQAQSVDQDGNHVNLSDADKQKVLLNDEITKYINGQLVSKNLVATILGAINNGIGGAGADKVCKFVKSGWGQTIIVGTAVAGAVVAFFTGGLSVGWGTAAQISAGVSISIAMAMLTPKLIDMASATFIGSDELTNGNRAGNAITSGMGALNDQTSAARAIPALQVDDASAYSQLTQQVIAQNKAVDQATLSPLDASNPNTFMGSLISSLVPYTSKMSSLSGGIASLTQFATASFANLIPQTSAADPSAQFKQCQDPEYNDLHLAADPFCNIKHGLKAETLDIDSDTSLDYVISNGYIDEDTGEPKDADSDYAKYIKNCTDRTVSIGGFTDDNSDTGEECIQGNASKTPTKVVNCKTNDDGTISDSDPCKRNCTTGSDNDNKECKYNMFRLAFIDLSVEDGMDNGMANSSGDNDKVNKNGDVRSPVAPNPTIVSGYGPHSLPPGVAGPTAWHAGLSLVSKPTDVFASMAGEIVAIDPSTNTVTIKHADGLKTVYRNVDPLATKPVKVGDTVTSGQKIGTIACTSSTGTCTRYLDFSILIDGVEDKSIYTKYRTAPIEGGAGLGSAINPANYLKDNKVTGYDEAVNEN